MGDDGFTQGRPHPMIDPGLRDERLAQEAADPTTAVLLVDVVLGYGSTMDPLSGLVGVLERARPAAIVHVCGTSADPQDRAGVVERLRSCGALVAETNAEAAAWAAYVATGLARPMTELFSEQLNVVNVGLPNFADNIRAAGGSAVQLAWRPPGGGDAGAGMRLARLLGDERIEAANATALGRYLEAQPVLVDVLLARDAIAALDGERRILHAGPPIAWHDMCGPVQGAIAGAIAYEGWAATPDDAVELAASGAIALEPCHDHGAVGPMAGIISPSMPLWVVENATAGNRAYCNFNEGLGKVLRFGANRPDVLDRLRWMGSELFDVLQAGVRALGGVELRPIMAQALHMGDEVHNRNAAATGLLFKRLVPALLTVDRPRRRRAPRDRVRRGQRPLLPEPLDGRLQGDARRRPRRASTARW